MPALLAGGPALAAGARASASAQVVEPITVSSMLGAPVTLEGILAAWRAAQAGPQTGGNPIRLPSPSPAATPEEQRAAEQQSAAAEQAPSWVAAPATGLLQPGLAASISTVRAGDAPPLVIVAFN